MVALAVVAGALGGALATAGLSHFVGGDVASADNQALEASVARIDADILALKASVEHSSKLAHEPVQQDQRPPRQGREGASRARRQTRQAQRGRRQAPRHAAGRSRARRCGAGCGEGSHRLDCARHGGGRARSVPAPKPEVARLPTVEGWVLRDVANGGALIEGRRGMFEVYAGDPVPGSRPDRRHPPPGRPLGGRDQQGPDRRALKSFASPRREAIDRCLRIAARQRVRFSAIFLK